MGWPIDAVFEVLTALTTTVKAATHTEIQNKIVDVIGGRRSIKSLWIDGVGSVASAVAAGAARIANGLTVDAGGIAVTLGDIVANVGDIKTTLGSIRAVQTGQSVRGYHLIADYDVQAHTTASG